MNTHALNPSAQPAAVNGPARSLAVTWRRLRDGWQQRRRMAATRLCLSSLSDRTLQDLGLVRSEAGSVASELHGMVEAHRVRSGSSNLGWRQP